MKKILNLVFGYHCTDNHLNLPKRVGTTSQYISYIYSADGTKLAKVGTDRITTTWYAGSFVYTGSSLTYIQHPEGMYLPGGNYQYFLKDHLGNTRLVVNTSGTGGTIVQQTDYYPFGMDIKSYSSGVENKYRYNGKELQTDLINGKNLDWYDYGARFYDPALGRWHTPDPLAEMDYSYSPYTYVLNNPLKHIDPTGMLSETFYGDGARDMFRYLQSYYDSGSNDNEKKKNDDDKEKKKEEDSSSNKPKTIDDYPKWQVNLANFMITLDESINYWSDFLGGPEGENISTVDKIDFQIKAYAFGKILVTIGKGTNAFKKEMTVPEGWKSVRGAKGKFNAPVFQKGNRYISPDKIGHNTVGWKIADGKPENLLRKETRMGTYDEFLNKIGD